jgi:CubicO group peptidase (beta-lactamase class C family)
MAPVQAVRSSGAERTRRTFVVLTAGRQEAMMRTIRRILPLSLTLLGCATAAPAAPRGDDLDAFVAAQMAQRHIPGLSLAIIQGGRIVEARAYGVTDPGGQVPVTTSTLFQAGSISKSVSALGALRLVEQGRLDLDADVNRTLTTWKVPSNAFTATKPVTLRGLLSHTAGLTVHGFPGYAVDVARPTLVQVLNGEPPANTAPIRVDTMPGAIWRYSGGGYTVMQQMIVDVTGKSFPEFMRETVLQPIGMAQSSFEQPLPRAMAAMTAGGQYGDLRPVKGRWHVYPEMAAAGLWTTPSDLARFAIEVQESYAGRSSKVISPAMTRRMLTVEKQGDGLGVFLQGAGPTLLFNHGGRDDGFDASLNALAETGQGLVVMINANDNSNMMNRLVGFVAKKYAWPALASTYVPPAASSVPVPAERLQAVTGRYEFSNNNMLTLGTMNGRLFIVSDGLPDEEFVAVSGDQFQSTDRDSRIRFVHDASGAVTALTWTRAGNTRTAPRIGPLVQTLGRQMDPDPAFTVRLDATLRAMTQGGAAVASAPALTPGAQRDFSRSPWPVVAGYVGVGYISGHSVAGRGLERHDHPVDRIAYYVLTTVEGRRALMVYITKDGLITDFDDVVD